jgi:DNA-binding transcriptional MerR regulator
MRIGELAKRGNVSIKALRLYHDLHLLEPDNVDESGHRIYSERSLKELTKLQSLKRLGFSLLEIKGFLSEEMPTLDKSLEFQKNKSKEQLEEKKYELHRIEVAQKVIAESADVEKMLETVARLSRAEDYFTLNEIKQIETINRDDSEIRELLAAKETWYEGIQDAFKKDLPVDDPKVQLMASKWDRYASYWRKRQPEIAQKVEKMDKETPREQLGVLSTPEFQSYVKMAIDVLKK